MNFINSQYFLLLTLLFQLSSCSIFKSTRVSKNLDKEIQNVCLNSYGSGRIIVNKHKYVFSFDSALSLADQKWMMGLNFPVYGEEVFSFEWDENDSTTYNASFEQRILKDARGVDPEKLEVFLKKWSEFIYEVVQLQYSKKYDAKLDWQLSSKYLETLTKVDKNSSVKIRFQNKTTSGHFGRFDIVLQRNKHEENFKLEMIVRKCLEKPE